MRATLKRGCLLILQAYDGLPMPEAALLSAMATHARPAEPSEADCKEALRDCESEGFAQGHLDTFDNSRSWTLTEKGIHKARSIR
jgi:hypothetical protein